MDSPQELPRAKTLWMIGSGPGGSEMSLTIHGDNGPATILLNDALCLGLIECLAKRSNPIPAKQIFEATIEYEVGDEIDILDATRLRSLDDDPSEAPVPTDIESQIFDYLSVPVPVILKNNSVQWARKFRYRTSGKSNWAWNGFLVHGVIGWIQNSLDSPPEKRVI